MNHTVGYDDTDTVRVPAPRNDTGARYYAGGGTWTTPTVGNRPTGRAAVPARPTGRATVPEPPDPDGIDGIPTADLDRVAFPRRARHAVDLESLDEWHLVALAQAGDGEALGTLYRIHLNQVYLYAYIRTHNAQVAQDIAADVFVRVLKGIGRLQRTDSPPGAWIMTIARHMVIDYKRLVGRRPELPGSVVTDNPAELFDVVDLYHDSDPAEAALAHIVSPMLRDALHALPPSQRLAVMHKVVLDRSIAHTATAMEVSEAAAKSLVYRAIQSLRRILGCTP